jgi:cation:H+ antiporter
MGIGQFLLYLIAFGVLSYGSTLIINTISNFTRRVRIPPFIFSFFVVGLLTSVAEIAVAINAVSVGRPEIFVGSILGGTLAIFLIVIPMMTILNRGIHVKKHMSSRTLAITLVIIAMPAIFSLDKVISNIEGVALIVLYSSLILVLRSGKDKFNKMTLSKMEDIFKKETKTLRENTFLRLGLGGLLIFLSSRFIVDQTLVYSEHFHVSAFLVSLIVIALGTTLPEISLALHTAASDKAQAEDIAIGDFLGSAAANVLIFGVFTLINNGDIITAQNFTSTFLFIVLALISFYAFTRGKSILTTREGFLLMGFYGLFVLTLFLTA